MMEGEGGGRGVARHTGRDDNPQKGEALPNAKAGRCVLRPVVARRVRRGNLSLNERLMLPPTDLTRHAPR